MTFSAPVGYDGSVTESQWARMMAHAGAPAVVEGLTDLRVTTVPGQDRTLSVAAGTSHAHGVMSTVTVAETIQLAVPTTTRWDAVCLRRNWTANTVTVVAVQGTTTQSLPTSLENTPGTLHDQPLALVQVTAGQQLPTAVVDLRVWASKVLTANSILALTGASLGTEALVGNVRYRRVDVAGTVTTHRLESWGTAALSFPAGSSGGLSGIVSHGLGSVPTNIQLTPVIEGAADITTSVDNASVTTTGFRISLFRHDGAWAGGVSGLPVYWHAWR